MKNHRNRFSSHSSRVDEMEERMIEVCARYGRFHFYLSLITILIVTAIAICL